MLFCLFLFLFEFADSQSQQSHSSAERHLSDSPYNLCRQPLFHRSNVTASSEMHERMANDGRLHSGSAWSAKDSDINQFIMFDLGKKMNVTTIITQGRSHTNEYVREFRIQYGTNGQDFKDYKDVDGMPRLFDGNIDGFSEKRNVFEQPIIAQWIKINPTRWDAKIAMRVEVYGCEYIQDVLRFDGKSMLKRELRKYPISSRREIIRFRFKTNHENGVLLYSRGTQEDYLALQLVENRLLLNINLGASKGGLNSDTRTELSMTLGSLLDDNVFHEIYIQREFRDISLSVDRVIIRDKIPGMFNKLDLDGELYIGGVPHVQRGLVVYDNFTGCIENLYLNHTNVIFAYNNPLDYERNEDNKYTPIGTVSTECGKDFDPSTPVTFRTKDSFVKLPGFEGATSFNVTFQFRTFEQNGLLLYHSFSSEGYIKVYLENARIKVKLAAKDSPEVEIDNFDQTYNDGIWHKVGLSTKKNEAIISVNSIAMITTRIMTIRTGAYYYIGGGWYNNPGFVGCMRRIVVDGTPRHPTDWKDFNKEEVIIDSCLMIDRCNPNPCEHGGICKQNSQDFECECEHTHYAGAVCHTSLNWLSCVHFQNKHPESRYTQTIIDIDGSGPIPPVPVTCEFFPGEERNITYINHEQMQSTKVDGFEEKGSYYQEIQYHAPIQMIETLVNRSRSCVQKLGYECKRSRLLNTPVSDSQQFQPFGWWTSRQNRKMDYWAGALPGSRKCECGISGDCYDPDKWCNCDGGADEWQYDGGELKEKEYLPVKALYFGDTGVPGDRKEGRYNLGPLECNGDMLFENSITFRKSDGVIVLPTFEMGVTSGDIFFEFKTSLERPMVLLYSDGDNGDFIKVSLVSGDQIQFEFSAGKGALGVTVEISGRLDDNEWHSVLIEKNRKEAVVIIDGAQKTQVPEQHGPVRPFKLTSPLYVGATNQEGDDGYVGCMRALVLNGVPVDLAREVTKNPWGLYGVALGCTGKCARNPCQNNGKCIELYDSFKCNCRWTPFKGPICADEIGVNMEPNMMIKYDFKGKWRSTIAERIHVGFTTTDPKGFLLGLESHISKEYLTLMVSNSGHIRLVFDFGFERQELVFKEQDFRRGQYHDVLIERYNDGRNLRMTIDNYPPQEYDFSNSLKASGDAQFDNIQYMYIGKNESMKEGFKGCISRVEFDEIIPIKLYFQEDAHDNINSIPEVITEDFCGIEPVTLRPEEEETRRPPHVNQETIKRFYSNTSTVVYAVVLLIIFALLIFVCCATGKYIRRHKGDYYTQEDEGAAGAFDADTAVLQGRTGHKVQDKKEWFI